MEQSELYNSDTLFTQLDQERIKYLVKTVNDSDRLSLEFHGKNSEELKLTRNALRASNTKILDEIWDQRYRGAEFPWSDLNLRFALENSDFRTIVHVFKEWSFGCEERYDQLTSVKMIKLAKKNVKCGDRVIEFIKEVETLFGDIYIYNVDISEDDDISEDIDKIYEQKCDQLRTYISHLEM